MIAGRILVIDDEASIRELIQRILKRQGHETQAAASAEEALLILEKIRFDLVLLDMVLPGMSGMNAIAEIKKRSTAAILAMTGHFDPELRKDAMLLGALDMINKPLDLKALDNFIRSILDK